MSTALCAKVSQYNLQQIINPHRVSNVCRVSKLLLEKYAVYNIWRKRDGWGHAANNICLRLLQFLPGIYMFLHVQMFLHVHMFLLQHASCVVEGSTKYLNL